MCREGQKGMRHLVVRLTHLCTPSHTPIHTLIPTPSPPPHPLVLPPLLLIPSRHSPSLPSFTLPSPHLPQAREGISLFDRGLLSADALCPELSNVVNIERLARPTDPKVGERISNISSHTLSHTM